MLIGNNVILNGYGVPKQGKIKLCTLKPEDRDDRLSQHIFISGLCQNSRNKINVLGDTGELTACLQAHLAVYLPALEVQDFSAADQTRHFSVYVFRVF